MSTDFFELGQHPQLGEVPKYMLAQTIRESRFGDPKDSIQPEKLPVPEIGPRDVLVYIMAVGVNYNGVWAGQGIPVNVIKLRQKQGELEDFHIPGSDASGVVWKVGEAVTEVKVGDEVIVHCGRWDKNDPEFIEKQGSRLERRNIWGYESNYGGFAQYAKVQVHQCIPKPTNLTWEEAGCFLVGGATAYRMLHGWAGNTIQPGDPVLIWGGAGSLGAMGIQIAKVAGARPIAVVSSPKKAEYCRSLGAVGTIDRSQFNHWGMMPHWGDTEKYNAWIKEVRRFGKAFWEALGERKNPTVVLEHPGEDTIPTSMFVVDFGGMVAICAGTSGYNATLDLRYHWMRQKRLQGSHFASDRECRAFTQLVADRKVDPCVSQVFPFEEAGLAHQTLHENNHSPGNLATLVGAPSPGMTSFNHR